MSIDPALAQFIDNPDTMDFIIRNNEYLLSFFQNNPDVVLTQTIGDIYLVGYVNRTKVDVIVEYLEEAYLNFQSFVCGLLETESLEAAGIYQVQQQPYLNLKGRGVLIGFVDTGIDYTNEVFRYEDGTSKIQYIYDQTIRGNTPEGFFFGAEYTNAQINAALKEQNPYDIVSQKDVSGHGTFLASVAAGRETASGFVGAAPDSELIAVKLRKARPYYLDFYRVPPDQEYAYESIDIMIGIEYIIKKARELNRPLVICLALGTNFGGHDGTTIFEEYITGISNLRGVCVCIAAGNESQARHHFQGLLKAKYEEQNIDVRVGENAGSFLMAIRNTAADRISVSVRSPTGELVGRVPARSGTSTETGLVLEKSKVTVKYFFPVETSGDQATIVVIDSPTPGVWTVIVRGDIVSDGTYHAWLPLTGLVSPNVGFLTPTPYTTTVVPATALGIVACGAYNIETESLYVNSSWGPTRTRITKPDLAAPGVDVGGYYPTGSGTMTGTSVSTAITAGASALLLQWGIVNNHDPSMSTYHIRAYLIRGCTRSEEITYPNQQWGYGSLNLLQTFNMMREI